MNCKKIKQLIMTDYIDGELNAGLQRKVKEHIRVCPECRRLLAALEQKAVEPFKGLEEITAPESVWEAIKESIPQKQQESAGFLDFIQQAFNVIFHPRRPALVTLATLVIVLALAALLRLPLRGASEIDKYFEDQVTFFSTLETGYLSNGNGDSLGTDIEEYFL